VQTFFAVGLMRVPQVFMKYNDFMTFSFDIFSRNRVPVEPSVAQTRMMAQKAWFDADRCLLAVSLMCVCFKGSGNPKKTKI
jgi:hypothetical protein